MKRLTREQVISFHDSLIRDTGGEHGIRDESLLDSALNTPFASFDGISLFSSTQSMAARLMFGLVQNHAFIDGNKRIGVQLYWSFLNLTGSQYTFQVENFSTLR